MLPRAQGPHLEVQAARLTMQGATRLFKIRGFPGGVFFTLIFVTQNTNIYKYHELGNLLGDNSARCSAPFKISDV